MITNCFSFSSVLLVFIILVFFSVFSYDEMKKMYLKCVSFVGMQMQTFEVLYR